MDDDLGGYRLLDAGDGRRLEAFGTRIVDRPAPTADAPRRNPAAWSAADLRFTRDGGWAGAPPARRPWTMAIDGLQLELRPTASGQVGVFPEHQASLAWLRRTVRHASGRPPTILNLFAYTGLVTLALAAAGAAVVHVDAARSAVTWARRNADLSGLGAHRIRWIVDDAEAFTARERRRNRRYDGIVLDPPSWGHADGGAWRLDDRLAALLVACAGVAGPGSFCLLTTHTTGLGPASIAQLLAEAFGRPDRSVQSGELQLRAASGARLGLGAFGRIAA